MIRTRRLSWEHQPTYAHAVRDLVLAHHTKDLESWRSACAAIDVIGWGDGPSWLLGSLAAQALNAVHPNGFEGHPLDREWFADFNDVVVDRHGGWLTVHEGLTLAAVQAARGFNETAASVPRNVLALHRAMLFEVAVNELCDDNESFDDAMERWFAAGIDLLTIWTRKAPDAFSVVPATFVDL